MDQIMKKLSKEMLKYEDFWVYKKKLIETLNKREPGVHPNQFENVRPELYIDYPIQEVPLNKIENLPDSIDITKQGLEQFAKMNTEPREGAFHGIRLGRQVDVPIAVIANEYGTFTIIDGIHRAIQAAISNNENVLAFVVKGKGPRLKDIFAEITKNQ